MEDSRMVQGGLYQCCVAAIMFDPGPDTEGRKIRCTGCKAHLKIKQGIWTWINKDEYNDEGPSNPETLRTGIGSRGQTVPQSRST